MALRMFHGLIPPADGWKGTTRPVTRPVDVGRLHLQPAPEPFRLAGEQELLAFGDADVRVEPDRRDLAGAVGENGGRHDPPPLQPTLFDGQHGATDGDLLTERNVREVKELRAVEVTPWDVEQEVGNR